MPGVRPGQLRPGHGGERAGHGSVTEAWGVLTPQLVMES